MNLIGLTAGELVVKFRKHFADVASMALTSGSLEDFRAMLSTRFGRDNGCFTELIDNDASEVYDLSRDSYVKIDTFGLLRRALRNEEPPTADFMMEMYTLFHQLCGHRAPVPSKSRVIGYARRWAAADEPVVTLIREVNRRRIKETLVERIEHRHAGEHKRFVFPEGADHTAKLALIDAWWSDFRFHLVMAARSPREVNRLLGGSLDQATMERLAEARHKGMPFFLTPYYATLLDTTGSCFDDQTIRSYVLYTQELVDTYGNIKAWEKEDAVEEGRPNAAGWILPAGGNVHRRYPDVAILIPDSMGRACGGLCASCQRMYGFQQRSLNFEFSALKPNEEWASKLRRTMRYFEYDPDLRDILITGGDALMSQNKTLRNILEAVLRMAVRKRRFNEKLPAGERRATIDRVRLGTRIPAYLPMRINDEMIEILASFLRRGTQAGIRQFVIQTHFQSPLEFTPETCAAIKALQSAGWMVTNQLVFTVAASRRGHTACLRKELGRLGVVCYYTFSVKGFAENYALYAPNGRSVQEMAEEKCYGVPDQAQQAELTALAANPETLHRTLPAFLKRHNLPFAATDRNVMNLPGIGKSITFATVGVTPAGERILRFSHDPHRRHSPAVENMGEVYITENKSIGAYLRHLEAMGEDPARYDSVWDYRQGVTERRMPLFEY